MKGKHLTSKTRLLKSSMIEYASSYHHFADKEINEIMHLDKKSLIKQVKEITGIGDPIKYAWGIDVIGGMNLSTMTTLRKIEGLGFRQRGITPSSSTVQ